MDSDYRFEKNDELFIQAGGGTVKIRVMFVRVSIRDGKLSREILGLKL